MITLPQFPIKGLAIILFYTTNILFKRTHHIPNGFPPLGKPLGKPLRQPLGQPLWLPSPIPIMILFTNISILGIGVGGVIGVVWGVGAVWGDHKGRPYDFQYGVETFIHRNLVPRWTTLSYLFLPLSALSFQLHSASLPANSSQPHPVSLILLHGNALEFITLPAKEIEGTGKGIIEILACFDRIVEHYYRT